MRAQARDEQEEWPGPMFPPERRVFMPISEHRLQLAANQEFVEARNSRARMVRHEKAFREYQGARVALLGELEGELAADAEEKAAAAGRGRRGRRKDRKRT
jgi:hypothetical protein